MLKLINFCILFTTWSVFYEPYGVVEAVREPVGITNDDLKYLREEIIEYTNIYRGKYNIKGLKLNNEMNDDAQYWANFLATRSVFEFDPRNSYGVILTKSPPLTSLGEKVVEVWYNKIQYYKTGDRASEQNLFNNKEIGPMTQLLWISSSFMGVGVARGNYLYYIVAYFNPKGNIKNSYNENLPSIKLKNVIEGTSAQNVFNQNNNNSSNIIIECLKTESPMSTDMSSILSSKTLNPSSHVNYMDEYSNSHKTRTGYNKKPISIQSYIKRSDDSEIESLKRRNNRLETKRQKPVSSFEDEDVDYSQDEETTANYEPENLSNRPNSNSSAVKPNGSNSKLTKSRNNTPKPLSFREPNSSLMEENEIYRHQDVDLTDLLGPKLQNYEDQPKKSVLQPVGFKDEDEDYSPENKKSDLDNFWLELINAPKSANKQSSLKEINNNRTDKSNSKVRVNSISECVNMKPIPNDPGNFSCMPRYKKAEGYHYVSPRNIDEKKAMEIRQQVLKKSNYYRHKHNITPLKLDDQLNYYAQEWANHLAESCKLIHRPNEKQKYGENGYRSKNIGIDKLGEVAVDLWYNEIGRVHEDMKEYEFNGKGLIGHMTQLLWEASLDVGVGVSIDNKNQYYVVANYNPSGNIQNYFLDNLPIFYQIDIDEGAQAQKEFNKTAGVDTVIM